MSLEANCTPEYPSQATQAASYPRPFDIAMFSSASYSLGSLLECTDRRRVDASGVGSCC